jgi:hypothetical protein
MASELSIPIVEVPDRPGEFGGQAAVTASEVDEPRRLRGFEKLGQVPKRLFPLSRELVVLGRVPSVG